MSTRARDTICLLACAILGALVWAIHETSLSHAVQRPLKIAVIVVVLASIGLWRTQQIRRATR
jgi:hypothetical protein